MADELPVQSGILDPLIGAGFFTPNMSLEEIKRRRAIGAALASRARPFPKTIGEGLTYFGEALAEGRAERQLAEAEKKYNTERDAADPTVKFLPGAAAPPVAVPPPVAAVPPPAVARPSPALPAPAGPMAGVNPLTVEPTSGPASRKAIARTLAARSGAVPPAPTAPPTTSPTVGAAPAGPAPDGATFAEEGGPNPPTVSRDIKPMLVAEAATPGGLRPPDPRRGTALPPHPVMGPPTPEEVAAAEYLRAKPGDEVVAARAAALAKIGRDRRENAYREAQEKWKLDYSDTLTTGQKEEEYGRKFPQLSLEHEEAVKAARLQERLGGRKVEDFVKDFKLEHAEANKQISALNSLNEAENAIKAGAITGYGRDARVNAERMSAWMLGNKKSGDIAAQSQILQSTLQGTLSVALAKFQGGDSRVTEGDLKAAQGLIGTPDMQKEAILKLTAIAKEEAHNRIDAFEERRQKRVGGTPLEDDFPLTTRPTASPSSIKTLLDRKDDPNIRAHFDNTFGPGSAQLEINRARRAAERRR